MNIYWIYIGCHTLWTLIYNESRNEHCEKKASSTKGASLNWCQHVEECQYIQYIFSAVCTATAEKFYNGKIHIL